MSKIKSPVTKGKAKVPVSMQLEAVECGAVCLAMVMAYYGKWVPLEQVRADCGVSRDGSTAKNIAKAALSYGFKVEAFKRTPKIIRENGKFPCIIHWNFDHFVVLCGFKGKYAYINDPAKGAVKVDEKEFDKAFTGVTLDITPGDDFQPSGKKQSILTAVKKETVGSRTQTAVVGVVSCILALITAMYPFMSGFFIDELTDGHNSGLLRGFAAVLLILAVLQLTTVWIRTINSLKVKGKLSVIGCSAYMWKIVQLPMNFFSQRTASDVYIRMDMLEDLISSLSNMMIPLVTNTVTTILCIILMLMQSTTLTIISVGVLIVDVFLSRLIARTHENAVRVMERDKEKLASETISGLSMLETIKVSGAESSFFEKWAGLQAAANTQRVKTESADNLLSRIPELLSGVVYYLIMLVGVSYVMQGKFTFGMVWIFQGMLDLIMSPVLTLSSAEKKLQTMRTQYERAEDILGYPSDNCITETSEQVEEGIYKLKGNIELKNVTFGYSPLAEPIIKNFSLSVGAGSRVAVVGTSGCGKSTLSKLISGLYEPWEGEILFDGKPRQEISRDVMTGSVAVVDQEIMLFEGTVKNNIKMWDNSIEDFEVILAARDAQIHNDIIAREGGYQSMLSADGRNLSGGQRQRIEIARVLAADPSVIIMDEATSALDAKTEYDVTRAITDRGITCIIIAHRLSAVRDCDEIIVLDKGAIIERGTHEQLMEIGGRYTELVTNE